MKYLNYKKVGKLIGEIRKSTELYEEFLTVNGNTMNEQSIEMRLWNYIDGLADEPEQKAIEHLLAENQAWKDLYETLLETQQELLQPELEGPSLRFTKNVMESIARYQVSPAARTYFNKNIIRGIASFFLIIILAILIIAFSQVHWKSQDAINLVSQLDFSKKWDLSKIFNRTSANLIIMLNVMLALVLFDKYLGKRKRMGRQMEP